MITHTLILAVSTFCNPVSLPEVPLGYICRDLPNGSPLPTNTNSWRYTFWKRGAACRFDETHQFRETADPAVYVEGDRWYLYPSLGLLWTSDDCGGTWTRVPERERGEYAPAIAKFRGKYYLCTSGGPLSVADRPEGPFRELGKFDLASFGADPQMPSTQDPALLADGDSLYLYWGCCAKPKSLWGVELDPENPLKAKRPGSAVCLMEYDETRYPWLNELIEGCWVFKRGDTYYLTYSTANTCGPKYAWCASKGKAPLGPFTPQKRNPFFVTEKGLVTGTGHGSIWRDSADRWWISSCTIVGAYHGFERLIAVDRLFFEVDGDIRVGHASDTPQWLPCSGKEGPTGWQAIPLATAAKGAVDGRLSTWSEVGRETVFEFDGPSTLEAARLIWRDLGLDVTRGVRPGPYRYRLDVRTDGKWRTWIDASANETDLYVDYREGPEVAAEAVRLTVLGAPKGITPALTEFTVFGTPALGAATPFNDGWTADGVPVTLPHCWNVDDGADGPVDLKAWNHDSVAGTGYRRQKVTYRRALPPMNPGKRYYLRIHAASIHAVVALDGAELARHDGAFTAFTVPIPRSARESQVLSITVDNFYDPDVPPICGDFTMYGGLYRGVEWIEADPSRRFVAADGLFEDELAMPAGLPKYEMRADGFYVDGVKTFLKGVCCHQDREGKGWAISAEDEEEDVRLIKAMGANAIRTSHYPRSERFYDLCDKHGLYVWTEAPAVDAVTDSAAFRTNYLKVVREMVLQHRRHKCVAMWGLFNELYLKKMPAGLAEPMVREAKALVRALDPAGRPIVAATCQPGKKELNAIPDGLGINVYPGWYGTMKASDLYENVERDWRIPNGRSTICISEYGAGGSLGQEMPSPDYRPAPGGELHPWAYQLKHHETSWAEIRRNEHVWGCFVWEMFDSGADARHEGARNGINDKGLVCFDHRTLKPSYEFYRRVWNGK